MQRLTAPRALALAPFLTPDILTTAFPQPLPSGTAAAVAAAAAAQRVAVAAERHVGVDRHAASFATFVARRADDRAVDR